MVYGPRCQRYGTTKNIVEGIDGFIVGATSVVFIGNLLKKRINPKPEIGAVTGVMPEG